MTKQKRCVECEAPFDEDEWENACTFGAGRVHPFCCVMCRAERREPWSLAKAAGELGLPSVTWNEPA